MYLFFEEWKKNQLKLYKEIGKYEHEGRMRMIPRIGSGKESEIKLICSDNNGMATKQKLKNSEFKGKTTISDGSTYMLFVSLFVHINFIQIIYSIL